MRDEVKALRNNYQTKRRMRKLVTGPACTRCGMTAEQAAAHGRQIELHHIISLADCADRGITDEQWVNSYENLHSLCYFCHKEWHVFWETLNPNYELYYQTPPFRPNEIPPQSGPVSESS